MNTLACMILAAGLGTRMGELTKHRPKPLIEVGGRPLLDHALEQARAVNASRIVVNAHYHADQICSYLASHEDVIVSEEQPELLDSGGGIRAALPILQADVIATLNADAVWTGAKALVQLRDAWVPDNMDVLALLVPQSNAIGRKGGGDFGLNAAGQIGWDRTGHVFTGAQILKASLFENCPQGPFSVHQIWNKAMASGRMMGILHRGWWADVGHPQGIALAEAMLQEDGDV